MTLHKLKVAALQHEQREDWGAAIELYREAIREAEGSSEGGDPSLYNRVGDLAHKAGDNAAACEAWEQAVSRYGDLGFLNSAIALCGKILRLDPTRVHTYLELARLQARKRVLYDVRQNLRLYIDRMGLNGHADAARKAVTKFGDEFPGWRELGALLDQLLGREHDTTAWRPPGADTAPAANGRAATGLVFIDTGPLQIERASGPVADAPGDTQAKPSVVGGIEFEPRPDGIAIAGLEATSAPPAAAAPPAGELAGLVGGAQAARDVQNLSRIEGLDVVASVPPSTVARIDGLEQTSLAPEPVAADDPDATIGGDLVFLQTDTASTSAPDAAPLHDDPLGTRVTAHALLEHGDRAGGIAALEQSLLTYQEQGEWLHAYHVATELIQAEPASIGRYQARVEVAARMRDPARLCESYVELGDALVREGSVDKAVSVYRRVLELDDGNQPARAALHAMAPEVVESADPSGFIDLGAMLIDDHPRSTRMRTETPDVDSDENETFRDALAEFKRALDQNLPIEDHQAHYDLGIAFKEMGLLDEAISEFQKALRAPEVRLRTSEALGEVFFDQGRPAVAEAVLRGVETGAEGDAQKIGVLYWLGRALDAQGKHREAIGYYQRIVAVDVAFRDASDRLNHGTEEAKG
jgi:tetratricopeptide (TPR) repeat protein